MSKSLIKINKLEIDILGIRDLQHKGKLQLKEIETKCYLAYLNTHLLWFQHSDYLPEKEFNLIIYLLNKLPKTSGLISELLSNAIIFCDILLKKNSINSTQHLQLILDVMISIPNLQSYLNNSYISFNSRTAKFLQGELNSYTFGINFCNDSDEIQNEIKKLEFSYLHLEKFIGVPVLLQDQVIQMGSSCIKKFEDFIDLYFMRRLSISSELYNEQLLFICENQGNITRFIRFVGEPAIELMIYFLSDLMKNFKHEFSYVPRFNNETEKLLAQYAHKYFSKYNTNIDEIKSFKISLNYISACFNITSNYSNCTNIITSYFLEDEPPSIILSKLFTFFLNTINKDCNDFDFVKYKINKDLYANGSKHLKDLRKKFTNMRENCYKEIFFILVSFDLLKQNIDEFLHNTDQANYHGRQLARHNSKIREILQAYDFNLASTLNYQNTIDLNIEKNDAIEPINYQFCIKQLSKSEAINFFYDDDLLNHYSDEEFPLSLMVQWRVDDSLLIHGVLDKTTNLPVAILMLSLAINVDNEVVLIAHHFKPNGNVAKNESLKKMLLIELLKFSDKFYQDNPSIVIFHLRDVLRYQAGIDQNKYPPIPDLIGKIGGIYIPNFIQKDTILTAKSEIEFCHSLESQNKYYDMSDVNHRLIFKRNSIPIKIQNEIFSLTVEYLTFILNKRNSNNQNELACAQSSNFLLLINIFHRLIDIASNCANAYLTNKIIAVNDRNSYITMKLMITQIKQKGLQKIWGDIFNEVLRKFNNEFGDKNICEIAKQLSLILGNFKLKILLPNIDDLNSLLDNSYNYSLSHDCSLQKINTLISANNNSAITSNNYFADILTRATGEWYTYGTELVLDEFSEDVDYLAQYYNTYFNTHISIINNDAYFPLAEFNLLIDILNKFQKSSPSVENLFPHLISISDILFERTNNNKYLEKTYDTFRKLFIDESQIFNASSDSHTIKYLKQRLTCKVITKYADTLANCYDKIDEKRLTDVFYNLILKHSVADKIILTVTQCFSNRLSNIETAKIVLSAYKKAYENTLNIIDQFNFLIRSGLIYYSLCLKLNTNEFFIILNDINLLLPNPYEQDHFSQYRIFHEFYLLTIGLLNGDPNCFDPLNELLVQYNNTINLRNETVSFLLKTLGKITVDKISMAHIKNYENIPPLLISEIIKMGDSALLKFNGLLLTIQKINESSDEWHHRNIYMLLCHHLPAILQLLRIMKEDAFTFMKNCLNGNVLNLESELDSMPLINTDLTASLANYFHLYFKVHKKTQQEFDIFKTCIICIDTLIKLKIHENQLGEVQLSKNEFYIQMSEGHTPLQFLMKLVTLLLKKLFIDSNFIKDLNEEMIKNIFHRIDPVRLTHLAVASQKMSTNEYKDVYLNLLKHDLFGGDLNKFLHDVNQESAVARDLAMHNQNIRTLLKTHKISQENALSYEKTYDFVIKNQTVTTTSSNNILLTLWSYINKLEQVTDKNSSEPRIHAILKCINTIKNLLKDASSNKQVVAILKKDTVTQLIAKIKANLTTLAKYKSSLSAQFKEFSEHVLEQITILDQAQNPTHNNNDSSIRFIRVEQMQKSNTKVFEIAAEVGCCLAPNREFFPAIVQRRMDDAMLFHVAIDQVTKRAVALIWLYLAITKAGKIVLVANFFEVNAAYAKDTNLRLGLLNGLLYFTHCYCKDNPGIDAFYMGPLHYGWNHGDLDTYPLVNVELINKLGGPYLPFMNRENQAPVLNESNENQKKLTLDHYYLVSLMMDKFHIFSYDILEKSQSATVTTLYEMIQTAVYSCKDNDVKSLTKKMADQLRFDLANIFTAPLEDELHFQALVRQSLLQGNKHHNSGACFSGKQSTSIHKGIVQNNSLVPIGPG